MTAPLRRWAVRWTQPNGVTGLGDGYDDHDIAIRVLAACRALDEQMRPAPALRIRYSLEDRHAGSVLLALATTHDAATCPACVVEMRAACEGP